MGSRTSWLFVSIAIAACYVLACRVYRQGHEIRSLRLELDAQRLADSTEKRLTAQRGGSPSKGDDEVEFTILTADGIQEGMYVPIGGIKQWIQIRGENRDNPVLLFIHGGPGASVLARTLAWQSWERYFTIVQWDQRGAGRTYRANGDTEAADMTVERMSEDGIEVAQYIQMHLHKRKILLVGHSWGSILSIHMIKRRPDLFAAYVGTGQVVNMERSEELDYAHVLAQAKSAHNDRALAALADIGPPPYDDFFTKVGIERDWANELASGGDPAVAIIRRLPPGISPIDIDFFMRGMQFSSRQLGPRMSKIDLPSLGADFSIPIFFFEGTADQMTPVELAEQYFEMIKAPHKEFVRFEGDHHFVLFNRPNEFLTELVNRVRPLAVAADGE